MKSLLGSVSLLALVIATPAFAEDNENTINQTGVNNQAGIIQLGIFNKNTSTQTGSGNFDWTLQAGAGSGGFNTKNSTQTGVDNSIVGIQFANPGGANTISATQTGITNTADIWQLAHDAGSTNSVVSTQESAFGPGAVGQHLNVLQYASGASSNSVINTQNNGGPGGSGAPPNNETADVLQVALGGSSNQLENIQGGQNDYSKTLQVATNGGANIGKIDQQIFSDSSTALLAQFADGSTNNGKITQGGPAGQGDFNSAGILQVSANGGINNATIEQYGSTNDATTVQFAADGGSNLSNTVQTGIGNEAKVYQNTNITDHFATANGVYIQAQAMALAFSTPPGVPSLDLSGLTVNVTGGIVLTPVAPVHATNIMVPGTFNLNKTP